MTSASSSAQNAGITYASAGVDVEAGDRAVELMKDAVKATHNSSVIGGVGGFAGLYDVSRLLTFKRPLLATSTDGVGTKVAIAQAMDIHDTIGFDLVGMVVDDIVVVGAEPLYMTDYIACGKVVPERIADIVRGIAAACSVAEPPWWAAKPQSTRACWVSTSTTSPVPPPVLSRPTPCWVRTASAPATW